MERVKFVGQKEVKTGDLKPHPDNPNRGDVNSIAESLEQFGQYRSVVVLDDMTILAGHHVVRAAKNIGLKTLRVDVVDTDAATARKVMLADNRIPERGPGMDFELLLKNLEELGDDLIGSGYDADYVQLLEDAVGGPPETDDPEPPENQPASPYRQLSLSVDARLAAQWDAHRKLFADDSSAFGYLFGG